MLWNVVSTLKVGRGGNEDSTDNKDKKNSIRVLKIATMMVATLIKKITIMQQ